MIKKKKKANDETKKIYLEFTSKHLFIVPNNTVQYIYAYYKGKDDPSTYLLRADDDFII